MSIIRGFIGEGILEKEKFFTDRISRGLELVRSLKRIKTPYRSDGMWYFESVDSWIAELKRLVSSSDNKYGILRISANERSINEWVFIENKNGQIVEEHRLVDSHVVEVLVGQLRGLCRCIGFESSNCAITFYEEKGKIKKSSDGLWPPDSGSPLSNRGIARLTEFINLFNDATGMDVYSVTFNANFEEGAEGCCNDYYLGWIKASEKEDSAIVKVVQYQTT